MNASNRDKIKALEGLKGIMDRDRYSKALKKIKDYELNTDGVDFDEEFSDVSELDYKQCCQILSAMSRIQDFSKLYMTGRVLPILQRMIDILTMEEHQI